MKIIDNIKEVKPVTDIKGELKITYKKKDGTKWVEYDKNIVLNQSRTFIRNLVSGGNVTITKLGIGDMNKTLSDDCSNPPEPTINDTELVNEFFEKEYEEKVNSIDEDGNPIIKYTFNIDFNEANGSKNERKLWCELGLKDSENKYWTRKVKPIIKDNETKITIEYVLTF